MSYLVIARKFRPQTFRSIVGQDHVTRALANAILRGRIPHALLFTGPRGVGKTSCARVFAKALNCIGRTIAAETEGDPRDAVEPCGTCPNCIDIAKSKSLAVREVDGASNNSVDNVRELIESLHSLPPPGSRYKVYIIDEVHMLSVAAFNALLKSLEEPPPNTIFIFATTEPHKILDTVISRCQRHDFRAMSLDRIVFQLRHVADKEEIVVDDSVLRLVARNAQGSMRDSQSLFDRLVAFAGQNVSAEAAQQLFGMLDAGFFFRLSQSVIDRNTALAFELLDEAFNLSLDIRLFISDFVGHWRNLLVISSATSLTNEQLMKLIVGTTEQVMEYRAQAELVSEFDMQRLFAIAQETASRALDGSFPRFSLEAGIAKMASLPSLRPLPEILSRLEEITGAKHSSHFVAASKSVSTSKPSLTKQEPSNSSPSAKRNDKNDEDTQAGEFNPSWQNFVAHVQSRGAMVLSAHLRRVNPRVFADGVLTLEAPEFDAKALNEASAIETLRQCLYSYSGSSTWRIDVQKATDVSEQKSARASAEGSLAHREAVAAQERNSQVDEEARNHPLVQAALSTFQGSHIEKISVLK